MASTALPKTSLSRRQFLGGAAGLTFAVGIGPQGTWLVANAAANTADLDIGVWVRIATDNRITIITPAAEMGQGSMTGVPIALAEELEVGPYVELTFGLTTWPARWIKPMCLSCLRGMNPSVL